MRNLSEIERADARECLGGARQSHPAEGAPEERAPTAPWAGPFRVPEVPPFEVHK